MFDLTKSDRSTVDLSSQATLAGRAELMEATVAACALIAHADGEPAPAERRRIFAILRETVSMAVFSHREIAEEIAIHEANFRLDPEVAEQIAWEKLAPIAGEARAAALIVAACREILVADGVAHPAEYRMLARIKALLGGTDRAAPVGTGWKGRPAR